MVSSWTNEDIEYFRTLRPLDPNSFPYTPIARPTSQEAYCTLNVIRTGWMYPPGSIFSSEAREGEIYKLPSLAFLIEKKDNQREGKITRVLFELGLRDVSTIHFLTVMKRNFYPLSPGMLHWLFIITSEHYPKRKKTYILIKVTKLSLMPGTPRPQVDRLRFFRMLIYHWARSLP
jgi:hypothetical protein